jgi:cation:H+ antiporter
VPILVAVALTIPWLATWATGTTYGYVLTVFVSGIAVLGSAFLLAWAAETAEKDVPRAFAVAVLAVIAVLPEYAVDAHYAWTAGANFGTPRGAEAANLAIANMTGANRILIGIGWAGIALFTLYRALSTPESAARDRPGLLDDGVALDKSISTEITFLFLATLWAFSIPLGGGIDAIDTTVLLGLYLAYILIVIRGDVDPHAEHVGVPRYLHSWSRFRRVGAVLTLFAFSGGTIFVAVEPFAHGLEVIGVAAGLPPFFMIQWVAPLASEAPELIVVALLVNKARATAGFNTLISSKLNQWTLLIGTLAIVYSIAIGQVSTLPFDEKQAAEIWITAGQSFFAIAIITNFEINVREALVLIFLFLSQVIIEFMVLRVLPVANPEHFSILLLYVYTAIYLVGGVYLILKRLPEIREIVGRTGDAIRTAAGREPIHVEGAD